MKPLIIIGCGPSSKNFQIPIGFDCMCLNDSEKFISSRPNYLVCINSPNEFSPKERYDTIFSTSADCVLSHLDIPLQDSNKLIKFPLGEKSKCRLDIKECDFSSDSSYVGVMLAYKLGYTKIYLVGVDFINHPFLSKRLEQISLEYEILYNKLKEKGIALWNLSELSLLTTVPKYNLLDLS